MCGKNLVSIEEMYHSIPIYNIAYERRKYMKSLIRNGDVEAVSELLNPQNSNSQEFENLFQGDIRYAQDMLISHLAYLAEYSLELGMGAAEIEHLNRSFREKIHNASTPSSFLSISMDMTVTYTARIRDFLNQANKCTYSFLTSQCLKFISDHIFEVFTVDSLAYAMGVSTSHLQRQIRSDTGSTLKELILQKKIEVAKQLLSTSNATLSDVAYMLHFSSQSHFTACFRRITGLTPLVFRNKAFSCDR